MTDDRAREEAVREFPTMPPETPSVSAETWQQWRRAAFVAGAAWQAAQPVVPTDRETFVQQLVRTSAQPGDEVLVLSDRDDKEADQWVAQPIVVSSEAARLAAENAESVVYGQRPGVPLVNTDDLRWLRVALEGLGIVVEPTP